MDSPTERTGSRYEILTGPGAPTGGLAPGEVYIGFPYQLDPGSASNPEGKVVLAFRESDGTATDASEYWHLLRELPGAVRIVRDEGSSAWRPAPDR